ncbi:PEP-utilizing enzyme [Candidatus Pelagibacter sp.]|nr:PEP-utilizing enzyme [Candidatus Pelagibacter sp.]
MKFYNKAITLKKIRVKNAIIPKLIIINVQNYIKKKETILNKIVKSFDKNSFIIVRSSSSEEDTNTKSNAGKFESVPMVINKKKHIEVAINRVINSYKYNKKDSIIFVQKMISDCDFSGVITTCNLSNQAPYYVINYFDGNDTSAATSGRANTKNYFQFKHNNQIVNKKFVKVINLAKELENKFNNNYLDIEFGVKKEKVYLFQVRPIILNKKKISFSPKHFENSLIKLKNKIIKLKKRNHNLFGGTSYFGVMPDWNPAEMIGTKPKMLALSLYQELITDFIWAKNRQKFGFCDLTSNHLMSNFLGTPFIDIRVDFNSWIPKNIASNTKEKLMNYYLDIFKNNHSFHDKVEFKVLFTCYNAETEDRLKKIQKIIFNKKEVNQITNELKIISLNSILKIDDDIKKIEILKKKQLIVKNSKIYSIDKIYWYIEDCKRYGTEPFAGLARAGFIAVELLNSMVNKKIIDKSERDLFFQNLKSITTKILKDKNLSKKEFCKKYGHLRPSTYDISSKNYRENYNSLFKKEKTSHLKINRIPKFKLSKKSQSKVKKFLKTLDKNISLKKFISYLEKSIQFREYSKFTFTKSIDLIFDEIKYLAYRNGINSSKLGHLNIKLIKELYYNLNNRNIKDILEENIKQNKDDYEFNKLVELPQVIIQPNDVFYFTEKIGKPNFFGNKAIESKIYFLNNDNFKNLENKIICIKGADPGYDFIFDHKISGLITEYGGANSHMSIRCSELNIPAAIGVGSIKFNEVVKANKAYLDPISKKISTFK